MATRHSHYLNQCWLINNRVLWHSPKTSLMGSAKRITFTPLRGQWVKVVVEPKMAKMTQTHVMLCAITTPYWVNMFIVIFPVGGGTSAPELYCKWSNFRSQHSKWMDQHLVSLPQPKPSIRAWAPQPHFTSIARIAGVAGLTICSTYLTYEWSWVCNLWY